MSNFCLSSVFLGEPGYGDSTSFSDCLGSSFQFGCYHFFNDIDATVIFLFYAFFRLKLLSGSSLLGLNLQLWSKPSCFPGHVLSGTHHPPLLEAGGDDSWLFMMRVWSGSWRRNPASAAVTLKLDEIPTCCCQCSFTNTTGGFDVYPILNAICPTANPAEISQVAPDSVNTFILQARGPFHHWAVQHIYTLSLFQLLHVLVDK